MNETQTKYAIDQLVIWAMAEARGKGVAAELELEALNRERTRDSLVARGEPTQTAA